MEVVIPNLLIRTVSDPIESPFAHPPSPLDHDHFSAAAAATSAVSFRKPGNGGAGGSTSPLSQSPRTLHLEVKERWETSPKKVSSSSSSMLQDWAEPEGEEKRERERERERERVLSLGNWSGIGVEEGNFGQVSDLDAGERVENGGAFGLGAAAVGVSQG